MAWIQLNRELLTILGDAAFAQEIERSAYNDLLGAQAPDGDDWCYYSFPNGRRTHTTYWRCCKSSGAMALEELSAVAYGVTADGAIAINLLGRSDAEIALPAVGAVRLRQRGAYPFEGPIAIEVTSAAPARFAIDVRIPDWVEHPVLRVGDESFEAIPGSYTRVERDWEPGDVITLELPMPVTVHRAVQRNVQESLAPGNVPVAQEVMRYDFVALTRGPLVYATGLVDGFKRGETVRFAGAPAAVADGETIRLEPEGRAPIVFEPWYRAGGRRDGAWRLTWLGLAEEGA
jgi:DUF1680 family protein